MKLINLILFLLKTFCFCRIIDNRIIGGDEALDGEFPYLVSIQVRGVHDCGGAILNNRWILTAAHCLLNRLPKKMTVVAGTNHLKHTGDVYNVSKLIPHENFSPLTGKNDIGLLKVKGSILFGVKVQPILLPKSVLVEKSLLLAGWGRKKYDDSEPSNILRKLKVNVISYASCLLKMKPYIIWLTNVCTLNREGEGVCYGDSGGPLVDNGEVKAVVSWSKPCAVGKPDVSTDVYDYLLWINLNKLN